MVIHQGRISKITATAVIVAITPEADECNGCAVTFMCGKQEKLEISTKHPETFRVGQPVTIGIRVGMQRRGTFLFFILPVIILVASLVIALYARLPEWGAAIVSLCALGAWYAVLLMSKIRVRTEAEVEIVGQVP